jgi:hypothetical protein
MPKSVSVQVKNVGRVAILGTIFYIDKVGEHPHLSTNVQDAIEVTVEQALAVKRIIASLIGNGLVSVHLAPIEVTVTTDVSIKLSAPVYLVEDTDG